MSQTQQVEHTDSISSQDPNSEARKKTKSKRPPNTAFRQQRLKAWQPILTPKTVLPIFFIVGIIFAPIGGLLLYASAQVQELALDYTHCLTDASSRNITIGSNDELGEMPTKFVSSTFKSSGADSVDAKWAHGRRSHTFLPQNVTRDTNVCVLQFNVVQNIKPPIYFYYRLTNFYQNHRRYVKSFDTQQLKGDARTGDQIRAGECDPLDTAPDGRPYYPCGLIANSMFNDSYSNLTAINGQNGLKSYNFTGRGISWNSEGDLYGTTKYKPADVVPPPNWAEQYDDDGYDKLDSLPDLHTWEAFQVWMRTAGLPTFSKLAYRNDNEELKSGQYRLEILDRFPADMYGGTKSVLISTRTVVGGKNPFLGIAYVVVGGLCILLGTIFTLTHLVKPRKLGDHTYLSWNNDQPSTATTTGRARPGEGA